jgi:Toprim-like
LAEGAAVSSPLVIAVIGLAGTILGAVVSGALATRAKVNEEMRQLRLKSYPLLWQLTARFSRWPRMTNTYAELEGFHRSFRSWYYETGGFHLSENSRTRYGEVQAGQTLRRLARRLRQDRHPVGALTRRCGGGRHPLPNLRGASRTNLPPYGLSDLLAGPRDRRREIVLVEGFFDVHKLRARGIDNVAALGGTSVRRQTFERLHRLGIEIVTLCLDNDEAGRTATARAVEHSARARRSPDVYVGPASPANA